MRCIFCGMALGIMAQVSLSLSVSMSVCLCVCVCVCVCVSVCVCYTTCQMRPFNSSIDSSVALQVMCAPDFVEWRRVDDYGRFRVAVVACVCRARERGRERGRERWRD